MLMIDKTGGKKNEKSEEKGEKLQSRRFMSVLLCSSMLSTSVANTAAFAAATSEGGDERQEFSLEKEDLRQAIRDAAKKGKTVKEDAFTFSGDEAETYEGLFEEGNLYELHPDFEKKNDRLTLKMYARLEDEDDMDQYTISGNEEIIFLMTNSSSKERTGRILVDGRASAWMTVAPFGEVKKQVGLETEEAVPVEIENEVKEPESAVPAGSEDITEEDTALEDDVKEQENASDAGNNQIKEESEAADDKKDLSEPDSENENEKADMDASETDTSDANTSDADTSGADTSDADTSDSENDSAQDEDSVQVSRSAHFSMFLTSAAMASPSDAKEEENENDENEKNKAIVGDEAEEDNFERILGDSYETVGIKNASAAAFVTSAMELGLTDVAVLSAVEVEEIPHWQISKSKKATNLDENFESQVTLSLPSAEEKLENDIVFVLDKSTSVQLENEALEMLKELQAQAKENGAKMEGSMQKWTRKAAAVIAVICLAFGTAGVAMHKWDEMRQEKAHEELTAQVVGMSEAGTTGETMPEKKVPEVENEIDETNAIKETEYVSAIDFAVLDSQNPDVVAWIQIPGTQINYPVVQGKDNDYYLHRDLNGQKSTAGTIFLDYADRADFSSLHNVLYGHYMKNGSMFKDISRYKDQGYFDQHSEIILYTLEREIHLKALAAVCTSPDAIRRKTEFASGEEFASYIQQMTAGASASAPIEGTIVRLYSFVTCSYEFNNARTILYAYEAAE